MLSKSGRGSGVWLLRALRVAFSSTTMRVMLVPCMQSRYEPEEGQSNALLGDAAFRGGESALKPRAARARG